MKYILFLGCIFIVFGCSKESPTPDPVTPEIKYGSIFISTSPPNADIYYKDEHIGIGNTKPISLPVGSHLLVFKNDSLERQVEIEIVEGNNKPLFIKLQQG